MFFRVPSTIRVAHHHRVTKSGWWHKPLRRIKRRVAIKYRHSWRKHHRKSSLSSSSHHGRRSWRHRELVRIYRRGHRSNYWPRRKQLIVSNINGRFPCRRGSERLFVLLVLSSGRDKHIKPTLKLLNFGGSSIFGWHFVHPKKVCCRYSIVLLDIPIRIWSGRLLGRRYGGVFRRWRKHCSFRVQLVRLRLFLGVVLLFL
ncbi:uncharacterized protein CAALFM_C300140WA [Candida albicans SC5314]|uniref:Uncharacterized protein n=1 Tax=Candida albicans (strain SC5314 / ATCC MYA-2876) TaxID=237561 RepID=Q5A7K4_CANAL|nr:uncharacterized protein CAALFM_C300140WA [Candida albicans SC5314]AOW28064.1 hypothetical protein CAALFM_C300140WA [Candida albicans SC5314]|eukprot:XP_717833.1 hypothetical protein CAALFM_C300140WA [Candida albicans SC5314]